MPRAIVLGNQSLLVNIDKRLQIRDLFFPYVGEENHVLGHEHRIGVYVDGQFSWLKNKDWKIEINYDKNTLVSHSIAKNENLQLELHVHDCVPCEENIFLRKVSVKNLSNRKRQVKVFFYQDFHIYGNNIGDTSCYDAHRNAICHYKKRRYFLINAIKEETCASCQDHGDIDDYACGHSEFGNHEGTWKDAEDGELSKNPIAQGSVDSTIAIHLDLEASKLKSFYYWIVVGHDHEEVKELNKYMMENHPDKIFESTRMCWEGVVNSNPRDFKDLGKEVEGLYKRSILAVITHMDKRGAITAANDSDNMKFNRDTYSYCWPRDGALVAIGMDKAGFHEHTKPFFEFCSRVINKHGALLHKYNPDGSMGSTWHPWVKDGKPHMPIQEDETALVIYSLWHHYETSKDKNFCKGLFDNLIIPAADFMARKVFENGLPIECYDLWEEREGILTYTVSTVIAGIRSAAKFCKLFNDKREKKYNQVADKMEHAFLDNLWDEKTGMFLRMINYRDGEIIKDGTPESSTWGVFQFGILEPDDPRVVSNMEKLKEKLWLNTKIGGMARYLDDYYHKVSDEVPGNPWFITTMWYGQWLIAKAKKKSELEEAKEIINWVVKNTTSSGMMPEQVDPYSGAPLSVSPLTWSHSTFVEIVNDYISKYEELS